MTQTSYIVWPEWDSLSSTFKRSFKTLDSSVYETAGAIWAAALDFARRRNCDDSLAYTAMLTAVANVSSQQGESIHDLKKYLFTAFRNQLFAEMRQSGQTQDATVSGEEEFEGDADATAKIQQKILLGEIVSRMDDETRAIYNGLVLGYTLTEIADRQGVAANVLRSRFSKRLKKIAAELNVEPLELQIEGR